MTAPRRNGFAWMVAVSLFLLSTSGWPAEPGTVLLEDDFAKPGPLDVSKWELAHGGPPPPSTHQGLAISVPNKMWSSKRTFSEPVAVEFCGVFFTQMPSSADNHLGLAPGGYGPDMVSWCFRSDGGKKLLVPYCRTGGRYDWKACSRHAVDLSALPDLTKRENAVDLRIEWWPGKRVAYYLNGKLAVAFTAGVPAAAVPVGVRDESSYFRIDAIKVTALDEDPEAQEARRRTLAAEKRVAGLKTQFPRKLRMVFGGPCYFWGIDPVIKEDLEAAGMEVLVWPDAPLLNPDGNRMSRDPRDYNIVIFGDPFYHLIQPDPATGSIPKRITDQVPDLRSFLEAGGGIWFCGLGEQNLGQSSHALNYILKELGLDAEVAGEVVRDSRHFKGRGGGYPYNAWVDVVDDSLTEGVESVLHPSGVIASQGSMGVAPIVKLGPEWHVLLRGKPTAASFPYDSSVDQYNVLLEKPGTVKSSPILCAVRQAGKGRVVLWPTWSNFTVTGGSGGMVLDGENGGRMSDGARLIENLLCWLAEPSQGSQAVGTFDPETFERPEEKVDVEARLEDWRKPGRRDYRHQYKGLIGAHSNLSDGTSSPEEMIVAAKKGGYDFIAFTEDFAAMGETKWDQLCAVCDKANRADPEFVAYPGLDFLDHAGNRGLHFGQRYWVKDEWRAGEERDRVHWFYNFAYGADADANRWPPRVVIRSRTNAKRPWNQGLWNLFGAYCYEGGKLVDDSFHEWRPLIGRHVFFLNTGVMAVHTVRSAEEVAVAAAPGPYQTYVKADSLSEVLRRVSGCKGQGWMGAFPTYISGGPEIVDFRCYVAEIGGEISFDLAVPGNDRGWLHLLVQSEVGLKEVEVYDRDRLVRRFRPGGGKVFENFMPVFAESYHAYSMVVTDLQRRKAVSWNAFLQVQEKVHRRCGDNYNWMTTGKGAGTTAEPEFRYQLHEVTHAWRTRNDSRDRQDERPLYRCHAGNYGHGGLSAAVDGYVSPFTDYLVDGDARQGYWPVVTMDFSTIGRFGIIVTNTVEQDYAVKKRPKFGTYGCFSGPHEVVSAPWPAALRQFVPLRRPDGAHIARYQGKVRFTQTVTDPKGEPVRVVVGGADPKAKLLEVMQADGTSQQHEIGQEAMVGEVPLNGYVCWYDGEGDGVAGVIALSPGLRFSYRREYSGFHVELPSPVGPGDEATWDVLFVSGNRSTSNSNAQMEAVRAGMGIAGKPTLYDVRPRVGTVADQTFILTVDTEDHSFSGQVVKTTQELLPIHLPVMARGLNPRWDAVLWYRGASRLHTVGQYRDRWGVKTWRWNVATYEPRVDEVRHIPVLDGGVGYCQVETDRQDPDVFIGNPLVCDHPEVFLTLVKATRGACTFEANNPTEETLTCTVRPARGFELTGRWERTVTLPVGAWRTMGGAER